ncbi:hypothetical protein CRG98_041941 [Punica granatum]|uniref:Uncharacterized protein n=1 Tax=Punica granatum TaxID=22663 RepID=A0A2I0I112_PUNGR|nr:hypothetical protein CRG98_041941 [Punica granatum]
MILTNLFRYSITLTSVMFAGHLGELELAGATLANSWATVTGFAFMVGENYQNTSSKIGQQTHLRLTTWVIRHASGLEYWAFEILVLLAGLMKDAETTMPLIAMCTRVSNELGAGNVDRAKNATAVTMTLSAILGITSCSL